MAALNVMRYVSAAAAAEARDGSWQGDTAELRAPSTCARGTGGGCGRQRGRSASTTAVRIKTTRAGRGEMRVGLWAATQARGSCAKKDNGKGCSGAATGGGQHARTELWGWCGQSECRGERDEVAKRQEPICKEPWERGGASVSTSLTRARRQTCNNHYLLRPMLPMLPPSPPVYYAPLAFSSAGVYDAHSP
jgi:hypothetical protein